MILVDTSVWIQFLRGKQPFLSALTTAMEHQQVLTTACVFGELLQGAKSQRERDILISFWKNLPQKDGPALWIEAGILSSENNFFSRGVGLIDAFLVTLVRKNRGQLWTLDQKLRSVLHPSEIFE